MDKIERKNMRLRIVDDNYEEDLPLSEFDIRLPNLGALYFVKTRTMDGVYLSYVKRKDFVAISSADKYKAYAPKDYYCRAEVKLGTWDAFIGKTLDTKIREVAIALRRWLIHQDTLLGEITSSRREVKDI